MGWGQKEGVVVDESNQARVQAGAPPSLRAMFFGFSRVGLSGFGGVLPFVRRVVVEQERWLAADEFNSLLGLCQFLPGPNVINLSVAVGARFHGVRGALVCSLGLLGGPMLVALLLGLAYDLYGSLPVAQALLRGISAAGAGLIVAMGWRMGSSVQHKEVFLPFALLAFVGVGLLRWPMPPVLLLLAALSSYVAWRRLERKA